MNHFAASVPVIPGLTNAVLVTAARERFGMTLKGLIWAAARDGERWTKSLDAMELIVTSGKDVEGIW
jgi:hypothetical protein